MISLSLDLKTIVLTAAIVGIIIFLIYSNKNDKVVIDPETTFQPKIQEKNDTFWSKIIIIENEKEKLFQYQLPKEFDVNPKYLIYHPNFNISDKKLIGIVSEHEGEAVAMLNLWVSLNKGLLDKEENFAKLFETSIKRALHYPSVVHKFKSDINSMIYTYEEPQNLEYTEDLAQKQEPQIEQKIVENHIEEHIEKSIEKSLKKETEETQETPNNFEPLNSFDSNMALF